MFTKRACLPIALALAALAVGAQYSGSCRQPQGSFY